MSYNHQADGARASSKPAKKDRQRSLSSLSGYHDDPSQERSSSSAQMRRSSSFSVLAELPEGKGRDGSSDKVESKGWSVPWQWSRMRKAQRRKAIVAAGRRSVDGYGKSSRRSLKLNPLEDHGISSEDYSRDEMIHDKFSISGMNFNNPTVGDHDYQKAGAETSQSQRESYSSTSLCLKYQPKRFEDIAGHEIIIKAMSTSIQKHKVASLYLFHGPSGTGKTSTAKILAMALNCESGAHPQPCWNCRGCSRSLYMMELCSGSRVAGFERIRTLIQSTSFAHAIPGFKVFIVKECHLLTAEAWDELLGIVEGIYGTKMVFVLIAVDIDTLPVTVSSKCQKYFFPKLKDMDIKLKLALIAAREGIVLEREALQLIIAKAEGSLREAENILDQLSLVGSRITTSMVQEMVRLIPRNKLNDLLRAAVSGDTMETINLTTELIRTGVEPQALVSQLASLVKDLLSNATATNSRSSSLTITYNDKRVQKVGSNLINNQSERLCYALKVLVGVEKQSRSFIDQSTQIFAALLQIASQDNHNKISPRNIMPEDIVLPSGNGKLNTGSIDAQHHKQTQNRIPMHCTCISETSEPNDVDRSNKSTTMEQTEENQNCRGKESEKEPKLARLNDLEEIWKDMVEKVESTNIRQFLCQQVKLASFTIASANAIVHLIFKKPEDKTTAEMGEESISKALQNALGCPVIVNMSLEPLDLRMIKYDEVRTMKIQAGECSHFRKQQRTISPPETNYRTSSDYAKNQDTGKVLPPGPPEPEKQLEDSNNNAPEGEEKATTHASQHNLSIQRLSSQENNSDTFPDVEANYTLSPAYAARLTRRKTIKHRWLSVSSIQHSDATVEPYSQDILFENANMDNEGRAKRNLKLKQSLSKDREDHHSHIDTRSWRPNRSWRCKDIFCPQRQVGNNGS
ncbi:protein STICHEL-like 2 isoform X2 [Syzygium oleosum]|uniref:protein STICHEL-like 2 isoform X2 n=1 Tax=Syzygium oleosum TaxID=219896 RepID=UPI0024BAB1D4|nr:protein STICHEL-like 2 isoform X2 [Syzygium oleosum]